MAFNSISEEVVFIGLSSESKPVNAYPGQKAVETDTGDVYEFLGDPDKGGQWWLVAEGGVTKSIGDEAPLAEDTEAFIEYAVQDQGTTTTLLSAASVGGNSFNAPAIGFSVDDWIQVNSSEGNNQQYRVINADVPSNTISVDRIIDTPYPASTQLVRVRPEITNANGYFITAPTNQELEIEKLIIEMRYTGNADADTFGDQPGLVVGFTTIILRNGGTSFNTLTNWRDNGDMELDMSSLTYRTGTTVNSLYGIWDLKEKGFSIKLSAGDQIFFFYGNVAPTLSLFRIKAGGIRRKVAAS